MKFFVTLSLIAAYFSLASCRPQSVQIEKQDLHHVRSETPQAEKRGSIEETKRILQEIDKINLAMGYKKRISFAFPRVASGEGYFYPRQQFRPEFLTKPKSRNQQRAKNQRAINPFKAQNFYYPAPYLRVPTNSKPLRFQSNKYYYPVLYTPINIVPYSSGRSKNVPEDGSVKLGTIVVLPEREPKSMAELQADKAIKENKPEMTESSLIEDIVYESLGLDDYDDDDDDEEEVPGVKQKIVPSTTRLPSIKNDKYLNLDKDKAQTASLNTINGTIKKNSELSPLTTRAFNLSNSIEKIQNITKQFSFGNKEQEMKKLEEPTSSSSSTTVNPADIEEETEEKADDKEDEKSPFGFVFGPKQQLQTFKEGGLIIQRLRVRHGGIAIAGPGGVATAGSGGTAIVGPNGIAFTHPRTPGGQSLRDARDAQFADLNLITPPYQTYQPTVQFYGKYPSDAELIEPKSKLTTTSRKSKKKLEVKPEKLQILSNMDIRFTQAVQQPNFKFNIQHFANNPARSTQPGIVMPLAELVRPSTSKVSKLIKSQKLALQQQIEEEEEEDGERVKVESVGMSSADQPIPDYSAYFPRSIFRQTGEGDEATLILEPNSMAVSGNDGTSISTPLSRALLRKGTAVRVLFRPQSVAISGAGGTSHAQADLILDFIDE